MNRHIGLVFVLIVSCVSSGSKEDSKRALDSASFEELKLGTGCELLVSSKAKEVHKNFLQSHCLRIQQGFKNPKSNLNGCRKLGGLSYSCQDRAGRQVEIYYAEDQVRVIAKSKAMAEAANFKVHHQNWEVVAQLDEKDGSEPLKLAVLKFSNISIKSSREGESYYFQELRNKKTSTYSKTLQESGAPLSTTASLSDLILLNYLVSNRQLPGKLDYLQNEIRISRGRVSESLLQGRKKKDSVIGREYSLVLPSIRKLQGWQALRMQRLRPQSFSRLARLAKMDRIEFQKVLKIQYMDQTVVTSFYKRVQQVVRFLQRACFRRQVVLDLDLGGHFRGDLAPNDLKRACWQEARSSACDLRTGGRLMAQHGKELYLEVEADWGDRKIDTGPGSLKVQSTKLKSGSRVVLLRSRDNKVAFMFPLTAGGTLKGRGRFQLRQDPAEMRLEWRCDKYVGFIEGKRAFTLYHIDG